MGKKGKGGQKGSQSIKLKPNKNIFKAKFTGKAKHRKSHSKAVKTELKKSFDSVKTIAQLNADHNNMMTASFTPKPKAAPAPSTSGKKKRRQQDGPDVGDVTSILAKM